MTRAGLHCGDRVEGLLLVVLVLVLGTLDSLIIAY